MPRKKLSEYRSKHIITRALGLSYYGWHVTSDQKQLKNVDGYDLYVVKVDQAIKGRYKKGLIALGISKNNIGAKLLEFSSLGYEHFLIEPYESHDISSERYLSIIKDRRGVSLSFSESGGIDIESAADSIKSITIDEHTNWSALSTNTKIPKDELKALIRTIEHNHIVSLEINPYIVLEDKVYVLDSAIEVDDAAESLVDEWQLSDMRSSSIKNITESEKKVLKLDLGSSASFNLSVINPDGAIFLLLSGGGASVVIADEIYARGLGGQMANYGEYSGNPTRHETYLYTIQVLELIIKSHAKNKVLFIGGAIANFTNIAETFDGIIQAIDKYAEKLADESLSVFVRRGGPFQEIGLKRIEESLSKHGLLGSVYDSTTSISEALNKTLESFSK